MDDSSELFPSRRPLPPPPPRRPSRRQRLAWRRPARRPWRRPPGHPGRRPWRGPAGGPGRLPVRNTAVAVGALAAAVVAVVLASTLSGIGVPTADADPSTGLLRVAHLSPSTPAVDMYVSGANLPATKVASGVAYRGLTPYLAERTGTYTLQARPAGADPDSPPALSVRVDVPAGAAQTAAFVDIGPGQAPQLQLLDDQTARAADGTAQVRVVAAAAGLGPVGVQAAGGPALARDVFYGAATPYVTLPARAWRLDLRARTGAVAQVDAPLASGSVSSLVVTRLPDGSLTGALVPDAASSTPVPGPGSPPLSAPAAPAVPAAPSGPPSASSAPLSGPATPGTAAPANPVSPVSPAAPKAPQAPPRGGIEAGLGGLSATPADDDDAESAPPAARMPVMSALEPPAGLRPRGMEARTIGLALPSATDLRIDYRGALQVPTDFSSMGWYVGSAVPGEPGPAVFAGHVDTRRGPAVFGQLDRLRAGDPIEVPRSDGRIAHFTVDSVEYFPKNAVPTARIYGPTTRPELRLLTCGGPFDSARLSYRDNVVVFASEH